MTFFIIAALATTLMFIAAPFVLFGLMLETAKARHAVVPVAPARLSLAHRAPHAAVLAQAA